MNENKFELGQEVLINVTYYDRESDKHKDGFVISNICSIIFTGSGVFYRVGSSGIFKESDVNAVDKKYDLALFYLEGK